MSNNGYYTREDVNKMLKQRQGTKLNAEFAGQIGISPQLLSCIYLGTRTPNGKVLKFLKLKKSLLYVKA